MEPGKPIAIAPVRPNVPIVQTEHEYPERHVHPITYVHPETVVVPEVQASTPPPRASVPENEPEVLTPVKEKELTPVKQAESEKLEPKIDAPPQKNNFSGTRPLIFSGPKPAKKLKFNGKVGRQRTNEKVVELLTFVQTRGAWPHGVSDQMQRYYRREYPEYFRKTRKKGSTGKVPVVRPAPIDLQVRRHGTGV